MSTAQNPILAVELTMPQLYAVLGHAWFQSATGSGIVAEGHARVADACKRALLEVGEPKALVNQVLGDLINRMAAEPVEEPKPLPPIEAEEETTEQPPAP